MESFNLQDWTRVGAMNRARCTSLWSATAERSGDGALVWSEERRQFESGVALRLPPHSKTLSACRRLKESLDSFFARIGTMNRVRRELARERLGLRQRSLRSRRFEWCSRVDGGLRDPTYSKSVARAKAVTSRTPSPHSKTWRQIRRFMEIDAPVGGAISFFLAASWGLQLNAPHS
jgi:hypothetical protein